MKRVVLLFSFLGILSSANATIHLSYEKGTGGPSGTGRAEISCTPSPCGSNCSSGFGSCLSSAAFNDPCPTYATVLAACPGAGKIWLTNPITAEVADIWDLIEDNILTGSYQKYYTNIETNETVTVTFTWAPRSLSSDIFDLTIEFS